MITREDLQAAIAECQGQRNPNASTCIKLAAFLTIQEHMFGNTFGNELKTSYSYSSGENEIQYFGDSEFAKLVEGRNLSDVMKIMDELMQTLQVINPRLYACVLRKLE